MNEEDDLLAAFDRLAKTVEFTVPTDGPWPPPIWIWDGRKHWMLDELEPLIRPGIDRTSWLKGRCGMG